MGLGDLFKASENQELKERVKFLESSVDALKGENQELQEKVEELTAMLSPEHQELERLKEELASLSRAVDAKKEELQTVGISIATAKSEVLKAQAELAAAKEKLVETNEEILLQEFGLYQPRFVFATSDEYKDRLQSIRAQQKQMIKDGSAVLGNESWTVNGNATKGKKMVSDMKKLLLRAFNNECDDIVQKVKFNNVEASVKRIYASENAITKLGKIMEITISPAYSQLKVDEVYLAFEYQEKKQEEKEEQRRIKEELREQAKLQKEVEEARKKIAKDKQHYGNAIKQAEAKMETVKDKDKKAELLAKIEIFQSQLERLDAELKVVDYRAANQRAGYVYIISNIGAFGENVYKIGMTRRLDPMDRVDELGDASVPFKFDVHAMIFSDDAPKLETALHHAFEMKKVNMVNNRREFFRVSLDEIKQVIKDNFDKTVDFTDIPEAEQYRQSLLIAKTLQ